MSTKIVHMVKELSCLKTPILRQQQQQQTKIKTNKKWKQ